jgi:hypothetical protein
MVVLAGPIGMLCLGDDWEFTSIVDYVVWIDLLWEFIGSDYSGLARLGGFGTQ